MLPTKSKILGASLDSPKTQRVIRMWLVPMEISLPKSLLPKELLLRVCTAQRVEIWERIKRRIEEDGIGVLYSILINDSVLDAILRVQASEMPSGEEAEA